MAMLKGYGSYPTLVHGVFLAWPIRKNINRKQPAIQGGNLDKAIDRISAGPCGASETMADVLKDIPEFFEVREKYSC